MQLKVSYLKADILSSCGLQSDSLLQELGDVAGDKTEEKKYKPYYTFLKTIGLGIIASYPRQFQLALRPDIIK